MESEYQKKELTGAYVRNMYDFFLADNPEEYTYYRWFKTPVSRYHYAQSRRVFLRILQGKSYEHALEVGGGDGLWTEIFLEHVKRLDFLDISEEMIKRARMRLEKKPNITFYNGDFLANEFARGSYDAALAFRNIEYYEDKEKGIAEFSRVLKRDGGLIIVTKSPEYDWSGYFKDKNLHSGQISIGDLKRMLERHGFEVRRVIPAIIGKKIGWPIVKHAFDLLHRLIVSAPIKLIPDSISRYISESFIVYAVKK